MSRRSAVPGAGPSPAATSASALIAVTERGKPAYDLFLQARPDRVSPFATPAPANIAASIRKGTRCGRLAEGDSAACTLQE